MDGDITKNVTVNNNVNTSKLGNYEIIYTVSDSSKNTQEIRRKITVINRQTTYTSNGIPVLMYHFFYDKNNGTGKDSNWMEINSFEQQIKYLKEKDYYFPSWQEINDFLDGKILLPKKSIVITDDDGSDSFFNLAVPIIEKYQVKVTSFVVGDRITADKINKYNKSGNIYFESHTYSMHTAGCSGMGHGGIFNCISYQKGLTNLKKSIEQIGNTYAIAYPYGDFNDNIRKITKDAGFKMGFTTNYGRIYKGMDKLKLPRIRINAGTSLNSFKNIVA